MNNQPVAWRCKEFYETQEGWVYNENQLGEALYAHPVKELSDEEIESVWFSFTGDIKDFARAILRKAQDSE